MSRNIFDRVLDHVADDEPVEQLSMDGDPDGRIPGDDGRTLDANWPWDGHEPRTESVPAVTGEPDLADIAHPHLADPFGTGAETVREQARTYRERGVGADGFLAAYGVVTDALVAAAFDEARAAVEDAADDGTTDPDPTERIHRAEQRLASGLDDLLVAMGTGVGAYTRDCPPVKPDGGDLSVTPTDDTGVPADGAGVSSSASPTAAAGDAATAGPAAEAADEGTDDREFPLGYDAIADHVGACLFVLDEEGDVAFWNRGAEQLTGVPREEAYAAEMASEAFYHDGRRAETLADKVLDAPESADEEYGVPRVEDVDYTLYRDRSTMTDAEGEEVHISFSAAPLYEDGDLVGVVEMVQDRTEDVRRREHTADLVAELQSTMTAIGEGEYGARASFAGGDHVDDRLLPVVDELNDLAAAFETLATRARTQAVDLDDDAGDVAETSQAISTAAAEQTDTMRDLSREVSNLSATVEEVASSATEVDATSDRAERLATEGQASAKEAIDLIDEVAESADDVTDDVGQLRDRVGEIDDIVAVIDDIADQTNILALNASIEAARAGEAGDGFAVVADEVKQLAEESRQNATEIEQRIAAIQADTDQTVANLERTTDRIDEVTDQVQDAMARLEEVVDAISEASRGIQEVADATDDQAASTEQVAGMIDEAADVADAIADDIADIAAANEEQMRKADQLRRTVDENTF